MPTSLHLREVVPGDIALFYEHHLELRPLPRDATDADREASRARFMERWEQLLSAEGAFVQTIMWGGDPVGYVARFTQKDRPAISYWLGRDYWGKGIATQAVRNFLGLVDERPLFARVAYDNLASIQVLRKTGFEIVGHDRFFSDLHGEEIDEIVLALT